MLPAYRFDGAASGLFSGAIFFGVVLLGCGYIVISKVSGFSAVMVTLVPVLIMVGYALLLGLARLFRLRDDQSGDNLYYMGFLFTLTSLAVSLYQFSAVGSAEQIVQNFGIAIASTIAGITLRIFFNQMRRDPVEVEHTARLELAEASRKVKRELESTVLEFNYFRRATQQTITDALAEVSLMMNEATSRVVRQMEEFAAMSSRPFEEAWEKSGAAIEELNARISNTFGDLTDQIAREGGQLSKSTAAIVGAVDSIVFKLNSMQTPEQVIEIRMAPTIQGLSRAVNTFGRLAEAQARTVDSNLKQTQEIAAALTALVVELRAALAPAEPVAPTVAPAAEPHRPAEPDRPAEPHRPAAPEMGPLPKPVQIVSLEKAE